jgi:hypothetical protein
MRDELHEDSKKDGVCYLKPITYLAFEVNIGVPKVGAFLPEIADFGLLRCGLVQCAFVH